MTAVAGFSGRRRLIGFGLFGGNRLLGHSFALCGRGFPLRRRCRRWLYVGRLFFHCVHFCRFLPGRRFLLRTLFLCQTLACPLDEQHLRLRLLCLRSRTKMRLHQIDGIILYVARMALHPFKAILMEQRQYLFIGHAQLLCQFVYPHLCHTSTSVTSSGMPFARFRMPFAKPSSQTAAAALYSLPTACPNAALSLYVRQGT